MARVYLGLGSNIHPAENLRRAVDELRARFGRVELSPVYRSAAVGFEGDDFLNLVAGLDTRRSAADIQAEIEAIHDTVGRKRGSDRFGPRSIDIDLLLYDDLVIDEPGLKIPRKDVLEYSFVLGPLAELAPALEHPVTGRTIAEHWREAEPAAAALELVTLRI